MKIYKQFYGEVLISDIGKELRDIVKKDKSNFKIMTGYGSTVGSSKSKQAALKSLEKMKSEGLIGGYFPGDVMNEVLNETSPYYYLKEKYGQLIKKDVDCGNPGIIFVFVS